MQSEVLVVGAGAAGLMAAITAAKRGKEVIIIEHSNKVGKKLLITGKGRCNVTNNSDVEHIMKNIPVNPRFLFSALYTFTPYDTMDFFEDAGVPLKTERGERVFPVSDKSSDIVNALMSLCNKYNVRIIYDDIRELIIKNGIAVGAKSEDKEYFATSVIVATGGKSYSQTGSTGDGYIFAKQAGHKVTKLLPSLVPLVTNEKYCAEMMGLSLKNITLSLYDKTKKKPIYKELGEMLFTHFGVSGPLVLSASSHIRKMEPDRYYINIDLKPGLNENQLDARLVRDFKENPNRDFSNILTKLLPAKMIPVVIELSDIKAYTKANAITKEQRIEFVRLLKAFPITIKDFRPLEEAIITSGGIDVKEINPKTMESKLVLNLYFIGEVLDVDAYTGGYNLQIAWSTAYTAGMNV